VKNAIKQFKNQACKEKQKKLQPNGRAWSYRYFADQTNFTEQHLKRITSPSYPQRPFLDEAITIATILDIPLTKAVGFCNGCSQTKALGSMSKFILDELAHAQADYDRLALRIQLLNKHHQEIIKAINS
tara:strand:+ start:2647 stop:3033 length:387 start_codon:yes stop_codon:yes gene_type:complete